MNLRLSVCLSVCVCALYYSKSYEWICEIFGGRGVAIKGPIDFKK